MVPNQFLWTFWPFGQISTPKRCQVGRRFCLILSCLLLLRCIMCVTSLRPKSCVTSLRSIFVDRIRPSAGNVVSVARFCLTRRCSFSAGVENARKIIQQMILVRLAGMATNFAGVLVLRKTWKSMSKWLPKCRKIDSKIDFWVIFGPFLWTF